MPSQRLIADIGGTNVRFAIAIDGAYGSASGLAGEDFPTFEAAIEAYLAGAALARPPSEAAFAVAAPISGDQVTMTNHNWSFSQAAVRERFGFDRFRVVNDFAANALAIPYFSDGVLEPIGGGAFEAGLPKAILGPGTGLGVASLVPGTVADGTDGDWIPVSGEGGHVTLAPTDDRESAVLTVLRRRFDHVSAERLISGDGLVHLYETLCEIDGMPSTGLKAAQITDEGRGTLDPHCREAVDMFCAMLGSVAGNLALTVGARGGVYIAGGIVPRLGARFAQSPFRDRFEAKGRFKPYLAAIGTALVTHPNPALLGLARAKI